MAGNKEVFHKAMNQGHSAAWDQDWAKAADCYSNALDEYPDHPQALSSLGLALFEQQDYPSALKCYQKAGAAAQDDPVPQEKIARIYERLGRLNDAIGASLKAADLHLKARSADKAIENWVRVLSIQPENIQVRTRLAAVYEKLGRRQEAVNEYISVASLMQAAGDHARATRTVDYAAQIAPDNPDVRMAQAMLRSNQRLPRAARPRGGTGPVRMAQLRQMEGAESESPETDPISETRQRAMVQLASQLFDQAEETAAPAARGRGLSALTRGVADAFSRENADRASIILHLGQAIESLTKGDTAQAATELEYAQDLGLNQPAAHFVLGLLLKDSTRENALRHLAQSVRHPDYAMASHLLIAQVHGQAGEWQQAAAAYLQALALADAETVPDDQVELLQSQYDALIDSQMMVEDGAAMEAACQAVAGQLLRPDWRSSLLQARDHLPAQPAGSPPLPVAEMVLAMRGGQVVEAMNQVRKLAAAGLVRSALEEALYALQFAPTYMPLHVLIGELLLQEGQTSDAIAKFNKVAELHTVRGDMVRAIRMLKRIAQVAPTDLPVRKKIIDLLVGQDKIEEALQEYVGLAEFYYRLTELDQARQTYLEALKLAQKARDSRALVVDILMKVADIDMQRLNLRQALRIYEQVRTIQPENAGVRAQIVGLNYRLGQDPAAMKELDEYLAFVDASGRRKEGISFINDLLVDYSSRVDLRRRLADLLIRSGQVQEAVLHLDTAADALVSAGKHMEAVNLLETIISLNPPNITEYRTALESLRRDMLRR